jgi:hypothetical protein
MQESKIGFGRRMPKGIPLRAHMLNVACQVLVA